MLRAFSLNALSELIWQQSKPLQQWATKPGSMNSFHCPKYRISTKCTGMLMCREMMAKMVKSTSSEVYSLTPHGLPTI